MRSSPGRPAWQEERSELPGAGRPVHPAEPGVAVDLPQPVPNDERSRAYAVMNNVFLHLHPVRVRQHAVKFAYTFCLGGLSFFLFLVLTVTGVYLMFFYIPSETQAYTNILEIQSTVVFGLLTRNVHRWART